MAILLVASLAARSGRYNRQDEDIDLELNQLGNKVWDRLNLSLSAAKLDLEVFSLDVPEISQPLAQRLDVRPGIGDAAGS